MSRKANKSNKSNKSNAAAIEQVVTDTNVVQAAVEPVVEPIAAVEPQAVEPVVEPDPVAAAVAAHNATLAAPALPNANGIVRASVVVRPVKLVHAIAAGMYNADPTVTRKAVIAACVAQGIATHTARTQYQVWFTAQRNTNATAAAQAQARPNVGRTEPKLESSNA